MLVEVEDGKTPCFALLDEREITSILKAQAAGLIQSVQSESGV